MEKYGGRVNFLLMNKKDLIKELGELTFKILIDGKSPFSRDVQMVSFLIRYLEIETSDIVIGKLLVELAKTEYNKNKCLNYL